MNEDNYAFGFTEAEIDEFCDLEKMVDDSLISIEDILNLNLDDFEFDLEKML